MKYIVDNCTLLLVKEAKITNNSTMTGVIQALPIVEGSTVRLI
jgi:hypothetical protein